MGAKGEAGKKKRLVQKDLQNNIVSPVVVKKTQVKYVQEDYETSKFKLSFKDCDREDAEDNDELEQLVAEKIRAIKGTTVAKGDFDEAIAEFLDKIEEGKAA